MHLVQQHAQKWEGAERLWQKVQSMPAGSRLPNSNGMVMLFRRFLFLFQRRECQLGTKTVRPNVKRSMMNRESRECRASLAPVQGRAKPTARTPQNAVAGENLFFTTCVDTLTIIRTSKCRKAIVLYPDNARLERPT